MGVRRGMTGLAEMDIKLRFVHVDVDRYGHERLYFRRAKGQPKVRIREAPGTPGFYDRYHQLLALSEAGTLVISTQKARGAGSAPATSRRSIASAWTTEVSASSVRGWRRPLGSRSHLGEERRSLISPSTA